MSSIAPSDSASSLGKKKNRPGKNQRNATRALPPTSESQTGSASMSNASFFASQVPSDPTPQPGKFPVVFTTGVGEPTRDVEFSYSPEVLSSITVDLADRYTYNPRYAEFSSNSGYDDDMFERDLVRFFILGIAQQTVHAHVNMGLPLGDFSSISSTDVFLPTSLRSVVSMFGEFSLPHLGTRYLLRDYDTTVSSLVFAAKHITKRNNVDALRRLWLPMKLADKRTKFTVASALSRFLSSLHVFLDVHELAEHIFSDRWDVFEQLKHLLGDDDDSRNRFDFLFNGYANANQFVGLFTGDGPRGVLGELDLFWDDPAAGHLDFNFVAKVEFPELVDEWARKKTAISKFLSIGSGLANRSAASGSASQVSDVQDTSGVTIVKTMVALPAPELSLLACFPSSGFFGSTGPLNVVVTTSVPVKVRATEFLQTDWLG
jgi:hypothetical protein